MWFFSSRKARPTAAARRLSAHRPQLEALEDRCLLSSAGALDTSFGGTGVVTTSLSKYADEASAVLIQPWDGKIVVAGNAEGKFALARYNADGSLDSTFGSGGKAISKIGAGGSQAAALYPHSGTANDGKIVEAGGGGVTRFNPNGSTDTSFGSRGLAQVPWTIASVVIQADGKVVVDGDNGSTFELTRFNANGSLDTTFGSGGTVTLSGSFSADIQCLVLQADGKLVVGGENGSWPSLESELARFNPSGTLDTTFDSTGPVPGTVTTALANPAIVDVRLAIYPSTGTDTGDYGKIAAVGTIYGNPGGNNSDQITLARYNPDGSADSSFGQSGQVVTPFPTGGGMAWATAIQGDGKIVVAGNTASNGNWNFSLLRYNTDGSLDSTFSNSYGSQIFPNGGLVVTPSGTPNSRAHAVAVQPDGRIVAAGLVQVAAGSGDYNFMTARYLAGPEIGTSTASATTVTAGSSLTLTASSLTDGDPGATITQVAFYAIDSSGNQYLLGTGTLSSGVWTLNYTVSLASGSYTLFAQATDSDGIVGDSAFLPLTVQ